MTPDRRIQRTAHVCLAVSLLVLGNASSAEDTAVVRPTAVPGLIEPEQLEALDGTDPGAYFLLGERVARAAATDAHADLARRLLAIAYTLAREAPADAAGIAPASAMGLATLARSVQEASWLRGLAASLDPRLVVQSEGGATAEDAELAVRLAASEAIGAVRGGDGVFARRLLDRPEVARELASVDALMGGGGRGEVRRIMLEAALWPDAVCRGERFVRGGPDGRYEPCPLCNADPGSKPDRSRFIGQLRAEWALLNASSDAWSTQAAIDGGRPLRRIDPEALATIVGVDTSARVFRDGVWQSP